MSKATAIQLATASAEFTIIDTVADPEVSNGRACIEVDDGLCFLPRKFFTWTWHVLVFSEVLFLKMCMSLDITWPTKLFYILKGTKPYL